MEEVLDIYCKPYDPKFPQICMDETNKQLTKETRIPIKVSPGSPKRYDAEYERNGTSNIFIAYEPVWSIGTGKIPKNNELEKIIKYIKGQFKGKTPKVLYGGSVNPKNINDLKKINNLDGFLVGAASHSAKKFIDIVKKTYS